MNITILDDTYGVVKSLPSIARLSGHSVSIWQDHTKDTEVLARRLADADVLMLIRERTPIRSELIERLPRLKLITLNGVTPHIDLVACTSRGIAVTTRPYVSKATAELTWALILMSMRRLPQEMESLKRGKWQSSGLADGLHGKTLGVWGYGQIGRQVAGFGKAFGMNVLVWSRLGGLAMAREDGWATSADKRALFEQSDVLSLHVRLSPDTDGCVTYLDLCTMKPTALLINTSRARLIEDGALVQALKDGRPGRAAVDVFENEPMLDTAHPLLNMDNVICTPHLGYVEQQQYDDMYGDQIDRMHAFFAGNPQHLANPEVISTYSPTSMEKP